jgi:hypothetical protein
MKPLIASAAGGMDSAFGKGWVKVAAWAKSPTQGECRTGHLRFALGAAPRHSKPGPVVTTRSAGGVGTLVQPGKYYSSCFVQSQVNG